MPKQAIISRSLDDIQIIDTPIPVPKAKEVVIQVVVAGSNPKDWKYPVWHNWPHNSGDDIAGIVHAVGQDVYEFRPGDRVAALHEFLTENGAFAEYAVAPDWTTFHLPPNVSFEEAATLPVAAMTAAVALFADMKLPAPYVPRHDSDRRVKGPLLIYGASTAVGGYAAQYARLAGLGPVIGVAGRASDFARSLVDYVIDYRDGVEANVAAIEAILAQEGGGKLPYIFDAVSEGDSLETIRRLLLLDVERGRETATTTPAVVSTVLPPKLFAREGLHFSWPDGVVAFNSACPFVHMNYKDFGYVWSRYLSRLLQEGRLRPHPHEVIPGGLDGLGVGLKKLQDGKASAVKYVYRIEETGDRPGMPRTSGYFPPGKSLHRLRNFPFPADEADEEANH